MLVSYLRHIFYKADMHGDDALNFKEVLKLMQHLNVPADVNQLKQLCEVGFVVLFYINLACFLHCFVPSLLRSRGICKSYMSTFCSGAIDSFRPKEVSQSEIKISIIVFSLYKNVNFQCQITM